MRAKTPAAQYWSARAERYDRRFRAMPPAYADILSRCRRLLKPTDALLDLGCGSGQIACALAAAVKTVQACDLAPRMLDIAAGHAREGKIANISFSQQDASALAFTDRAFDAALSLAVLHLMSHPERALAELRRVLKPGGLLLPSAYLAGQSAFSRAGNALMSLGGYRDPQRWNADRFKRFVEAQGFQVQDSVLYPMFPIPMQLIICSNPE